MSNSAPKEKGPSGEMVLVFVCNKNYGMYTAYKEQYCPHIEKKNNSPF